MKILIAPDSFKGTMSSAEVAGIIASVLSRDLPGAEIIVLPMADGGEGTTEAVVRSMGGSLHSVPVVGPFGTEVEAQYGLLSNGRTAVIEMASASGMQLVRRDELDPMRATTYGTGELLCAVLNRGVGEIILGIGGSATVDGGAGMAQALGYELLTADGRQCDHGGGALETITRIDSNKVHPCLRECRIRVACDVTNPLLGERGAARVFGPQKGATPRMVERLEAGLTHLAEIWMRDQMVESVDEPGDGAAGGLGAGLRAFCGAEVVSGAELVAEVAGFNREILDTDILVTGEGRTDYQTFDGKLCSVLAKKAKAAGARVILISGAVADTEVFPSGFFDEIYASTSDSGDPDEMVQSAGANLKRAAARVARQLADRMEKDR